MEPEMAHALVKNAGRALPMTMISRWRKDSARLKVDTHGLKFSNPIGLAAGFDKDAI